MTGKAMTSMTENMPSDFEDGNYGSLALDSTALIVATPITLMVDVVTLGGALDADDVKKISETSMKIASNYQANQNLINAQKQNKAYHSTSPSEPTHTPYFGYEKNISNSSHTTTGVNPHGTAKTTNYSNEQSYSLQEAKQEPAPMGKMQNPHFNGLTPSSGIGANSHTPVETSYGNKTTNNVYANNASSNIKNSNSGFMYDDYNNNSCLESKFFPNRTGSKNAYGHYIMSNKCNFPISVTWCELINDKNSNNADQDWTGQRCPKGGFGKTDIASNGSYKAGTWWEYSKIKLEYYVCKQGWYPMDKQDKYVSLVGLDYRCRKLRPLSV